MVSFYVLWNSVFWHFGHGGRVSVLSSKCTLCPHLVQVYVPIPGFSPVVLIISPSFNIKIP